MTELRLRAQHPATAAHHALAIVEATSKDEVCAAAARALRILLASRVTYVMLSSRSRDDDEVSNPSLQIAAVEGDAARVGRVGQVLRDGAEIHALGRNGASWVSGGKMLAGVRAGIADAVLVPVGVEGVAVALVDGDVEAATLESATLIGAATAAALRRLRALDEGRALAHRLEALLQLQRALASGILEDVFATFASRLASEVAFEEAWVGAVSGAMAVRGDSRSDELELVATHGQHGHDATANGTVIPLVDTPLAMVLRSGKARAGGPTFLEAHEAATLAPWAKSAAVVPLVAHDAVVGAFVILSRLPHLARKSLLPDAPWLLAAVAEPLAMALQNAGLVSRIRSAMRDWQTTFDVMDAMVLVVDERGSLRRGNWALARRVGATPSALVGRPVASLFPGQTLPTPGGDAVRSTLVGPKGEPLRASAVTLPDGGIVIVIHDVRAGAASAGTSQSFAALRRIPTPGAHTVRGRILIVDDEASIVRAVSRTLGRSHEVFTATDGDEALAMIRQNPQGFDAIMTDVQMPRMGGIELYRALEREFPALVDRVIFMTGGVFGGESATFLRALEKRVLRKPFDPDILRRAVDERIAGTRVA